jgi:hypothetical protein
LTLKGSGLPFAEEPDRLGFQQPVLQPRLLSLRLVRRFAADGVAETKGRHRGDDRLGHTFRLFDQVDEWAEGVAEHVVGQGLLRPSAFSKRVSILLSTSPRRPVASAPQPQGLAR